MRLFTQRVAPNPTKVDLYLAEKEALGCIIAMDRVLINLGEGEQKSAEFSKKNPLQRVPVLELDDGTNLPESLAIIEYLEELWPEPAMIGKTPEERSKVRALERSIDSEILFSVVMIVHATKSPAGYPENPGVVTWFESWIKTPLSVLNQTLADGRAFVAGDDPTIADCTLGATLQFARFGQLDLLKDHEHIARWDEAYRERSSVKSVLVF